MRNSYAELVNVLLKLKAWIQKDHRYRIYQDLCREQFLPLNELRQLQILRFNKVLTHAIHNSPYYREKYSSLGKLADGHLTLADLPYLPFLTRQELQDHYKEILVPNSPGYYADSSGGSTGHPVNFWHDDKYKTFSDACELLFLSWMDVSLGDRSAVFWGNDRDLGTLPLKAGLKRAFMRTKYLNSFNVSTESLDEFLAILHTFRPVYIIGYASSLHLAARRLRASPQYAIRPKAVRSAAEMLFSTQRKEIQDAFGSPVYNFYGSREVSHLAAECSVHNGMHIFASGRIIEVVNNEGKHLPSGETGYLAITDLTNYAFPFIRYLNGDMGALTDRACQCGRTYPLLEHIAGRASDILFLNNKYVHGEYFTHLFYGHPEIKQFQVIQESPSKISLTIVPPSPGFDSNNLLQSIRAHIGDGIDIGIVLADEIMPTPSGKYRFTINRMI